MQALFSIGLAAGLLSPPGDGPGGPHVPEAAEMFWSILLHGADMGPGSGWFHPAENRYGWDWLATRFDADGDRTISAEEFRGPEDLDWSEDSAFVRSRMPLRGKFAQIDADSNGKISREEWDAAFARLAKDKDFIAPDDLAELLSAGPPRAPRPKPTDTPPSAPTRPDPTRMPPSRWTLLKGLFDGEIGSMFEGPHVGELAPDFTLKTREGVPVTLSDFRGQKPV